MNPKNNYNLLKRIFPYENCNDLNKLKFDSEGLWSITHPHDADNISKDIKLFEKTGIKLNTIYDMTAGIGGNTISFCKHFKNVIGVELDEARFNILKNNLQNYSFDNYNLINDDAIKILPNLNTSIEAVFIDPPWGGPGYKHDKNIIIKMSNYKMSDIVKLLASYQYDNNKIKVISFKLPYNFNFHGFLEEIKHLIKAKNKIINGNIIYIHLLLK